MVPVFIVVAMTFVVERAFDTYTFPTTWRFDVGDVVPTPRFPIPANVLKYGVVDIY
jgi:hypothetical protein